MLSVHSRRGDRTRIGLDIPGEKNKNRYEDVVSMSERFFFTDDILMSTMSDNKSRLIL